MLRACVLDFRGRGAGNWVEHLSLAEFAYNNSYQASLGMAPFEALYGRKCRSPICWFEVGERELTGAEIVDQMTDITRIARDNLPRVVRRVMLCRRRPLEFQVKFL